MERLIKLLPKRVMAAKNGMKSAGLDAVLITDPVNVMWLSDFRSTNAAVLLTRKEGFLITDFRYIEAAEKNTAGLTPVKTDRSFTLFDFINKVRPENLGIEEEYITYSFFNELCEKIDGLSRKDGVCGNSCGKESFLKPAGNLIRDLRVIKDDYEKDCLRRAEAIGDEAFAHILSLLKPGMTENEVALELEFFMRKAGAEGLSFDTIAVSGVKSSMPHGQPSDKKICEGEFLTMDYGCKYRGYCSDMTRTVCFGEPSEKMQRIYDIVKLAQETTVGVISSGKPAKEIDRTARDIIKYNKYDEYFGHGLGHGVGLEIHEAPTANTASREVLAPDMAVTVEPGIYLPGEFGVRIEDLVLVTETGCEVLSSSTKELIII